MAMISRRAFLVRAAVPLCVSPWTYTQSLGASSLFAQAAQSTFDRDFSSEPISCMLLDVRSESLIAYRWKIADQPVPVGSLIKPFTAVAYAQAHRQFPIVDCDGGNGSCWLPGGHGRIAISEAISCSCNVYFLQLARELSIDQANETITSFGLPSTTSAEKTAALSGLSTDWRVTPFSLVRAYAALARESRIGSARIFSGMRASASIGTARAISAELPGRTALAKTGTAHCTHSPRGAADGFTVVLYPADDPRIVLLTRVHGVTGATTAATAGRMLRSLENGQS